MEDSMKNSTINDPMQIVDKKNNHLSAWVMKQ